jgi:quinol-cytochrome oxidoreductase complex cytochrome b subunit
MATTAPAPRESAGERKGILDTIGDQLAIGPLIREYLIPVELNNVWYILGGVLMISLVLEIVTGSLLSFVYVPDAGKAYDISKSLIQSGTIWSLIINFHFYTAYVIYALVMIHMIRVFISAGYRMGKQGIWLIGVVLAALVMILFTTGESLKWDEIGFAVPWHVSEVFQAFGLDQAVGYTFAQLRSIPTASVKLSQVYFGHISVAAILLVLFIIWHFFVIKVKGISYPFWLKASRRSVPFSTHIVQWFAYSAVILGAVVILSLLVPQDPGTAPQLLPTSPLFGSKHGPGGLGYKPTFPIAWTHGMNVFFGERLGIEPDIWGTMVGVILLFGALILIPFVDPGKEPENAREAFSRRRLPAFALFVLFWLIILVGTIQNILAGAG